MIIFKLVEFLSLVLRRPVEFYDRVSMLLDGRLEHLRSHPAVYEASTQWQELIPGMEKTIGKRIGTFLNEPAFVEMEEMVRRGIDEIRPQAPFSLSHIVDFTLAQLCYMVCRAVKPTVVLETGVAYGVTSVFILKALEVNRHGILHSVDLPPLGRNAEQFVGILIPKALKQHWRLHRGLTKRILPSLLPQLGQVDIFVHDSLHTYRNMLREFQMVAPCLASLAVVIADDVDENRAFHDWVTKAHPAFWAVIQEVEKKSLFGVSILHNAHSLGS